MDLLLSVKLVQHFFVALELGTRDLNYQRI